MSSVVGYDKVKRDFSRSGLVDLKNILTESEYHKCFSLASSIKKNSRYFRLSSMNSNSRLPVAFLGGMIGMNVPGNRCYMLVRKNAKSLKRLKTSKTPLLSSPLTV